MITHCYSVRLKSLKEISDKAYKAISYDGSEDVIPKSQVFGRDWDVTSSEAYWISSWILSKKSLTYSTKKEGCFDKDTGRQIPMTKVSVHVPLHRDKVNNIIESLKK